MNLRLLLTGTLVALAHVMVAQAEPQALPLQGKYDGVVRITQNASEGLSTTVTLRAVAAVYSDGSITILTAIPQAPSSAGQLPSNKTMITRRDGAYVLEELISTPGSSFFGSIYPAVTAEGTLLKITYTTPRGGVLDQGNGVVSLVKPLETATVTFTFRKKREDRH